jgi:hypothetical protein
MEYPPEPAVPEQPQPIRHRIPRRESSDKAIEHVHSSTTDRITRAQSQAPQATTIVEPAAPQLSDDPTPSRRPFQHHDAGETEPATPRTEPATLQPVQEEPATAEQAIDWNAYRVSPSIQEAHERLRRCNLIFPCLQRQPHYPAVPAEDQSDPKYLIHTLKRQLTEAQQCTKSLFPRIIPYSEDTNKMGHIYEVLNETYKFFIIDNIVRSILFLKNQKAVTELKQLGAKLNELIKPHLSAKFNANISELYYIDARLTSLVIHRSNPSELRSILQDINDKLHQIVINFDNITDENIGPVLREEFSAVRDFENRFVEFIKAPEQQLLEDLPRARDSIHRIISGINELSQDRLTNTVLTNVPETDLHSAIAAFLPNIYQLESFQITVMCNDIAASIHLAETLESPTVFQLICTKFNELLDSSYKQATVEQQKTFHKHYLIPEELRTLNSSQLNTLLSKRILDLNKHTMTFYQYVHQVIQPYVNSTFHLQESQNRVDSLKRIKKQFEDILKTDRPTADGSTLIDKLFDETCEITNRHRECIHNTNQTIQALRMALMNSQDDIRLEKCDFNLVKEIEAFLDNTSLSLSDTHNKIANLTDAIKATSDTLSSIRRRLETISENEKTILSLTQSQNTSHEPPEQQIGTQRHGLLGALKAASTAIGHATDRVLTQAVTEVNALTKTAVAMDNRKELSDTQEALQSEIIRLNSLVQALRDAAKAEYVTLQNLQTLCTILDSHKNPHFRLSDQEKIENSLATALIKSNFLKLASYSLHSLPEIPLIGSLVKHAIQKIEPTADITMRQIEERPPHYPPLGQILFGSISLFNKLGKRLQNSPPIYKDDSRQLDITQEEQLVLDDRYTSWLINTQNPQYLLYDIAARARFNTGRFTPFIKPLVHSIEQHVLGGPYGKIENKHDLEELRKYPDYKVDPQGNIMYKIKRDTSGEFMHQADEPVYELDQQGAPIPIAIRKFVQHAREHYEQPGERYTDIMHMISDAVPLEHAWALLKIPPCTIRTIENILRIASQKAYEDEWLDESPLPAAPEIQQQVGTSEEPFVSTSATTFIWNGIKKLSNWPIRRINNLCVKALQYWTPYFHQTVNIITSPFIDSLPYKIITTAATTTKSYVQPKIHSLKIQSCRTARSLLYYLAANQMRLLESKVRQQKPISGLLSNINAQIKRHSAHGLVRWLLAEGAYNAAQIRSFARQYDTLGRIDPIIPNDPATVQLASIKNYDLRKKLGSLIEGWETPTPV